MSTRVSLDRPPLWLTWRRIPGGRLVIKLLLALAAIWGAGCSRSMAFRARPPLHGSPGIENGNLLPDLVAQIGGEVLDVIDGIDDHSVGQMLRIKRGELVGQRQHFAAIVEIAGKLEPAHRPFG